MTRMKPLNFIIVACSSFEHILKTMQCFVVDTKSTFFLEARLVLRVYRNSTGVKNYWGDFIPML